MTDLVKPNAVVGVHAPLAYGGKAIVPAMTLVDAGGVGVGGQTYTLAAAPPAAPVLTAQAGSSAAPTAGSTTTPVTAVQGGAYVWDLQVAGTSPSIILQSLGADGLTWRDTATRTTSGSTGVTAGQGATFRLYNNSANPATVSSNLT